MAQQQEPFKERCGGLWLQLASSILATIFFIAFSRLETRTEGLYDNINSCFLNSHLEFRLGTAGSVVADSEHSHSGAASVDVWLLTPKWMMMFMVCYEHSKLKEIECNLKKQLVNTQPKLESTKRKLSSQHQLKRHNQSLKRKCELISQKNK